MFIFMRVKKLVSTGFKSFARKTELSFDTPITAIVGPNGSGKSNVVESIRFVLGEQSMKSLRGKGGVDLIFKGSNQIGKMNRAQVLLTFDNNDRIFTLQTENKELSLDFNEIEIGREVFADGTNCYTINGNEVRHKDVLELIASVNIGSSGHHIISQGEADRLLSAHPRERKTMLEEALGLKVYHYRLKETSRKLDKTRDNMKETELLRREIAPHLRFLKKQVEKFEQAEGIRTELHALSGQYLSRQRAYLNATTSSLFAREQTLNADKARLLKQISDVEAMVAAHEQPTETDAIASARSKKNDLEIARQELERKLGRVEGMIEAVSSKPVAKTDDAPIVRADFNKLSIEISDLIDQTEQSSDVETLRSCLMRIRERLQSFVPQHVSVVPAHDTLIEEYAELKKALEEEIAGINEKARELSAAIADMEREAESARRALRDDERSLYEHRASLESITRELSSVGSQRIALADQEQRLVEEEQELVILLGNIEQATDVVESISPIEQETLRRQMERLKIKLEELGGGSGTEIINEFRETQERDAFLERELGDLSESIAKLETLMDELHETLARDFKVGLVKINTRFAELFGAMFGGGRAVLEEVVIEKRKKKAVDDEEGMDIDEEESGIKETGIDIRVSLPRKKVSDLEMLSGGERSLTSIALLFALSQVNPPPFLVLDETDAALDEANSRKYGDMIETLSKSSQLIVVTHNRETMSRAHVLYGVTLGSDDSSKLLSVKLEDAVKIAK